MLFRSYTSIIPPVKVNRGGTYPFSVKTDECDGAPYYYNGLAIYIDFNRDGDWNDAGEQAYLSSQLSLAPNTRNGTVTIPSGANVGQTRMRIAVIESTAPPACITNNFYGEVEDYLIEIGSGGITNQWSTGTIDSSWINVTPAISTTYTVSSTSAFGCVATASTLVTIVPSPIANITGPSTVCVPSTFTLDGGTGFAAYEWSANGFVLGNSQMLIDSSGTQWTLPEIGRAHV